MIKPKQGLPSLPQFKLTNENGKIVKTPVFSVKNVRTQEDPELESLRKQVGFQNLQTQLALMDRENIIQDLDPETQQLVQDQGLTKEEALALRSGSNRPVKITKKDRRYAVIRDNVDLEEDSVAGQPFPEEQITSTIRGLVGEKTNNKINDNIAQLIFQSIGQEGALKLSDWSSNIRTKYKLNDVLNLYKSQLSLEQRKRDASLTSDISKQTQGMVGQSQQAIIQQLQQQIQQLQGQGQQGQQQQHGGLPPKQGLTPPPPPPLPQLTKQVPRQVPSVQENPAEFSKNLNEYILTSRMENVSSMIASLGIQPTLANSTRMNDLLSRNSIEKAKTTQNYKVNGNSGTTPTLLMDIFKYLLGDTPTPPTGAKAKRVISSISSPNFPEITQRIQTVSSSKRTPKKPKQTSMASQPQGATQTGQGLTDDIREQLHQVMSHAENGDHHIAQDLYLGIRHLVPSKTLKKVRKYLNGLAKAHSN